MNADQIYEVINALTGPTEPIGSTEYDDKALANLDAKIKVVDVLLEDILTVAQHHERVEFSIQRSGKAARKFLVELNEALEEELS